MSNSYHFALNLAECGSCVVVVVELLAAEPDRDRRDVTALILDVEVPVSNRVTNTIDDSRCPERNPYHLHAPDERSDEESEEINVGEQHDENANPVQPRQHIPLEPVVRRPFAVLLENAGLTNRLSIVEARP